MILRFVVLTLMGVAASFGAPASQALSSPRAKIARCDIWMRNAIAYEGRCHFVPQAGGSFVLRFPPDAYDIINKKVGYIRVRVLRPGVANVSDFTGHWGQALRSQSDRACWKSTEFRVCAY